jgi:methyl-accepting chemotaxis protein
MKNFSLAKKMLGGFIVVALIAACIGILGIVSVKKIEILDTELYEVNTKPMGEIAAVSTLYQRTRVNLRDVVLNGYMHKDPDNFVKRMDELDREIDVKLKEFEKSIKADDVRNSYASLTDAMKKFHPVRNKVVALTKEGKMEETMALMRGDAFTLAKQIDTAIAKLSDIKITQAKAKSDGNTAMANMTVAITIALTALATIVALTLGYLITRSVTKPINRVVAGLCDGAAQIASASNQVSTASQSLAEGTSKQAASLEETSSSMEELSSMTKQNADNAKTAKDMMSEAKKIVDTVTGHMNNMEEAMEVVMKASEETGKIIKTIDEIAFQTNLLALNAAVEAARAGEAGAGFAVVADEVRNLAMRAAEAANNTSSLIENTIKNVKTGHEATKITQETFKENVAISGKIAGLIEEIAAASGEQAQGIGQINKAVAEMDKVTQATAANAEESASASEEMNAQALQLRDFVADLNGLITGISACVTLTDQGYRYEDKPPGHAEL